MPVFDQQGAPAGRDHFPTRPDKAILRESCYSQPRNSESKEVGKPCSQKDAVPALCSRSCRDCLLADP